MRSSYTERPSSSVFFVERSWAMPDAVVLLSGGLDSATTLAIAKASGYRPHAITFRYGQRHEAEIDAARRVAATLGVGNHLVVNIDLRAIGGSALTAPIAVPKDRQLDEMSAGIPVTYVPARNTIFLSFALAWAEVLDTGDIFAIRWLPRLPSGVHRGLPADGEPGHQVRGRGATAGHHPHAAHSADEGGDHPERAVAGRRLRPDLHLLRPESRGRGLRKLRRLPTASEGICRERHARPCQVPSIGESITVAISK